MLSTNLNTLYHQTTQLHQIKQNNAAQTLKQISEKPWQSKPDKSQHLWQSLQPSKMRFIRSAESRKRNISTANGKIYQTIKIYDNIEIQHLLGGSPTLKFTHRHLFSRQNFDQNPEKNNQHNYSMNKNKYQSQQNQLRLEQQDENIEKLGFNFTQIKNHAINYNRLKKNEKKNKKCKNQNNLKRCNNCQQCMQQNRRKRTLNSYKSCKPVDKNNVKNKQKQLQQYKSLRKKIEKDLGIDGKSFFNNNQNTIQYEPSSFYINGSLKQIIQNNSRSFNHNYTLNQKKDSQLNIMSTINTSRTNYNSSQRKNFSQYQSPRNAQLLTSKKNLNISENKKRVYMGRPIYSSKQKQKLISRSRALYKQSMQKRLNNQVLPMGYTQKGIGGNKIIFDI